MDCISIYPTTGLVIKGKYGVYRIKKRIGNGGNGEVFAAEITDGGETIPKEAEYAIKVLTVKPIDVSEREKRKSRFIKEIRDVAKLKDQIEGIIPIYDSSIYCETDQELLWYLMPMAEPYKPKEFSVVQKLRHMIRLGDCIQKLHELGYAHRDIKPKNLLMLNGKLCLSDFGLIWNIDDANEHITEVNDRLGPQATRPPELQPVLNVDDIDYRKSDVYMYAKTIWMIMHNSNNGFAAEYTRRRKDIYIDRNIFQLETAEPLHQLMEEATRHNYWERCDLCKCISYLELQLQIIDGDIPETYLRELKYAEKSEELFEDVISDEIIYKDPKAVLTILKKMEGIVGFIFEEAGKKYNTLPFCKVKCMRENIFSIDIVNSYHSGKKKTIELMVDYACLDKNKTYKLHSIAFSSIDNIIPTYSSIIKGLKCPNKKFRLNAAYMIEMVPLG